MCWSAYNEGGYLVILEEFKCTFQMYIHLKGWVSSSQKILGLVFTSRHGGKACKDVFLGILTEWSKKEINSLII